MWADLGRYATVADATDLYLRLNIGGKSYCIRKELYTEERTLMHDIVEATHEQRLAIVDGCDPITGEYYIERNSRIADHIIDFFATGSLHKPQNMCIEKFKEELAYWRISHDHTIFVCDVQLSTCCAFPREASLLKPHLQQSTTFDEYETDFDGAYLYSFRLSTWRFLEDPQSSVPAAIFAILSVLFVFASVFGLILGSMPEFQEDPTNASAYHTMHAKTSELEKLNKFRPAHTRNEEFPDFVYRPTDNPAFVLVVLEYVCIGWFTFEYFIRLIIYPKRGEFIRKTLNVIDMLTILPFYLELCLPLVGIQSHFKEFTGAMLVVRVLRVLRMARVFKLARYSSSLQTFGQTLKSSITELSMLSMFLLTGIIFFSTIMYYLEKDEPHSDFYSIPAACWWCV
ncbi:K+ channel tetramerisation domain protein [Ancylostoma ceylanicum]|uniref:K+ channel tetramerisation domain protein n=1 Tax=Ancylostoma ceylanicum TaxID=53326 RepID=A0A0D6LTE6_9BILA|nr:K+ channel tetramerisation domain protein [Ancylostoma ceylanicum]